MTETTGAGAPQDDPSVRAVRAAEGTTDADLGGPEDGLPEPPPPGEGGSPPPPPEETLPGR